MYERGSTLACIYKANLLTYWSNNSSKLVIVIILYFKVSSRFIPFFLAFNSKQAISRLHLLSRAMGWIWSGRIALCVWGLLNLRRHLDAYSGWILWERNIQDTNTLFGMISNETRFQDGHTQYLRMMTCMQYAGAKGWAKWEQNWPTENGNYFCEKSTKIVPWTRRPQTASLFFSIFQTGLPLDLILFCWESFRLWILESRRIVTLHTNSNILMHRVPGVNTFVKRTNRACKTAQDTHLSRPRPGDWSTANSWGRLGASSIGRVRFYAVDTIAFLDFCNELTNSFPLSEVRYITR